MSPAYKILGMSVKPHILAIGTLAATGAGVYYGLAGSNDKQKPAVTNDSTNDSEEINVEKLLTEFLDKDSQVEQK